MLVGVPPGLNFTNATVAVFGNEFGSYALSDSTHEVALRRRGFPVVMVVDSLEQPERRISGESDRQPPCRHDIAGIDGEIAVAADVLPIGFGKLDEFHVVIGQPGNSLEEVEQAGNIVSDKLVECVFDFCRRANLAVIFLLPKLEAVGELLGDGVAGLEVKSRDFVLAATADPDGIFFVFKQRAELGKQLFGVKPEELFYTSRTDHDQRTVLAPAEEPIAVAVLDVFAAMVTTEVALAHVRDVGGIVGQSVLNPHLADAGERADGRMPIERKHFVRHVDSIHRPRHGIGKAIGSGGNTAFDVLRADPDGFNDFLAAVSEDAVELADELGERLFLGGANFKNLIHNQISFAWLEGCSLVDVTLIQHSSSDFSSKIHKKIKKIFASCACRIFSLGSVLNNY